MDGKYGVGWCWCDGCNDAGGRGPWRFAALFCFVFLFSIVRSPARGRDGQGRERGLFFRLGSLFRGLEIDEMKEAEGQSLFVWSGCFCCPATRSNTQAPATGAVMD